MPPSPAPPEPGTDVPPEEVLNAALRLLSARARSVEELGGRLAKKGFQPEEISHCLRWLLDRRFLDDEAFARSLVRDRIKLSPRSSHNLRRELTRKGVVPRMAEESVEAVMDEEETSDVELAVEAARSWVRKQNQEVLTTLLGQRFSKERERARRRLYGFLGRRGFRGEAMRSGMEAGEEEARKLRD